MNVRVCVGRVQWRSIAVNTGRSETEFVTCCVELCNVYGRITPVYPSPSAGVMSPIQTSFTNIINNVSCARVSTVNLINV